MNKKPIKIITIGGGSSYTPEIAEGFINNFKNMPISEWWLVDINEGNGPEKLDIVFELIKRMFKKAGLENVVLRKTLDFNEAIEGGVDFVTTQFRVGRLPAREKDELIPIQNGMIGQETNGIGGMFKALRTLPVIWDYLDIIKEKAPNAWVINFTNPSGIISEAMINDYGFEKFIGVCNVPISLRKSLAEVYEIPWQEFKTDAAGLNHFVYFSDFWHNNKSLFEKIKTDLNSGELTEKIGMANIDDIDWDPTFVNRLNAIPCAYHKYYYKRDLMLEHEKEDFKNNGVRAQVVVEIEKALFEKYKDPNLKTKPKELEDRGGKDYSTVAVSVINAIYNDTNEEFVVSASNKKGLVENLPKEWVVEATCLIGKNGATKVNRPIRVPSNAVGNVHLMKQFERATINAFLRRSKDEAIMAMCINPLSHDDVLTKKVFNELYEAHKKYVDYLK